MQPMRQTDRSFILTFAALGALAVAGCSSSSGSGGNDAGTSGMSAAGAGTSGSGGTGTSGGGAGGDSSGSGGSGTAGASGAGPAGTAGSSTAGASGAGAGGDAGTSGAGGDATAGTGGTAGSAGAAGGSGGGTGGTAGGAGTAGSAGTGGGAMTLTSTAFMEGGRFPAANTCTGNSHVSPELAWTAGPSGTQSYAIILTDTTNSFVHWAIWDIPPATLSLPASLAKTATLSDPAGARQVNRFGSNGYFGPCPSGTDHVYQFEVHALDSAMLPVAATVPTTAAGIASVRTAVMAHTLGHADLTGVSNASQ